MLEQRTTTQAPQNRMTFTCSAENLNERQFLWIEKIVYLDEIFALHVLSIFYCVFAHVYMCRLRRHVVHLR